MGKYREYPLGQLSLHVVQARLLSVIALCLSGEFDEQRRLAIGCR
jgi:hypothetical protein